MSSGRRILEEGNKLHVFPKGFRYIMGDNNDRTQISVGSSDVALYSRPARQQKLVPTQPQLRVTATIHEGRWGASHQQAVMKFPTCWTGKSLDSSTIKSHGAHDGLLDVSQNASILLPQLMYQAEFHLGDIPRMRNSDFILSNGDDSMASFTPTSSQASTSARSLG
jgi:hypothetical protein